MGGKRHAVQKKSCMLEKNIAYRGCLCPGGERNESRKTTKRVKKKRESPKRRGSGILSRRGEEGKATKVNGKGGA